MNNDNLFGGGIDRPLPSIPEPGWDRIADAVISAVRATARRSRPIDLLDPGATRTDTGGDAPTVRHPFAVSDLAVRARVSQAVRSDDAVASSVVRAVVVGRRLTGIRVELSTWHGYEVRSLVRRIRTAAIGVVDDVIGVGAIDPRGVEIVVTEVEPSRPLPY